MAIYSEKSYLCHIFQDVESVIAKYNKYPHWCGDWLPHIHLKALDRSALEPRQPHTTEIILQVTAIPGFQTEMADKEAKLYGLQL